jgi:hypothetical protein
LINMLFKLTQMVNLTVFVVLLDRVLSHPSVFLDRVLSFTGIGAPALDN